jgi:hypothetical protein
MPQMKQASKQKRRTKADVAQTTAFAPNEAITLGEEEIADTSLATFYVFDKEKVGSGVQVARRGYGGCRGCAVRASGGCACHTAQL